MTREELIARIEAGEAESEILVALVKELQFPTYVNLDDALHFNVSYEYFLGIGIPDWLHSLDAAVALVGDMSWSANNEGCTSVSLDGNKSAWWAYTPGNPAAALVAAWLKATA